MRLDNVRVLDLSRLLPGPYATQLLADLGADVVKIEDTEIGDYARDMPPFTDDGTGVIFDAVNRGKRSVALDLKSEKGREAFNNLVEDADVIFEQFRPAVTERLGIDYESVRTHNENIIYCSLSGYGQDGPYADRPGHDLNYIGIAGLLDMTRRNDDHPPQIPGYPIGDMTGGLFAAFSIVGALASRALGNTSGEYIDISMTDVLVSYSQAVATQTLSGDTPRPGETPLTGGFPWYDVYETADGRYITVALLEPEFWDAFCETVDREEWIPLHMTEDASERAALREGLDELFASRTQNEWEDLLGADSMIGPVNTLTETFADPQISARDLVIHSDSDPSRIGFPATGTEIPVGAHGPLPEHGEHTISILREAGFDDTTLDSLRESDAIFTPD